MKHIPLSLFRKIPRLFQNFSFWNSLLRFKGKTGLLTGFSKGFSKTNRVLEQALPIFFLGAALGPFLYAETGPPEGKNTGEAAKTPPPLAWNLLWAGSWEEGKTLNNRGDLRLLFSGPDIRLRAEVINRWPLDFSSSPPLESFSQGLNNYGGGLYHNATGSRLLYGILDEWGLPARIRNPWIRALPFAENHKPFMADLKTAASSTGEPETYLYLGSPRLNLFPQGPEGGLKIRGFTVAQMDNQFQPGFGGGLEALFGGKAEVRLDGFYTGKTLPPRKSAAWFSENPPLPEREFRLGGLGLLLNTPILAISSDWALSETFAWGRDLYGNLGVRFTHFLPADGGRMALSLAADGAGSRYTGRDGSNPGPGFRSGGKLEWYGKRSSVLRLNTSLRSPGFGEAFNRSASSVSWRFPAPAKNSAGLLRLTRLSLNADRNAPESGKNLDRIGFDLGLGLNPQFFFGSSSAQVRKFFSKPVNLSFSASLNGLTAAEGGPAPYPFPQAPYQFDSVKSSGEIYWPPGIFQFRAKLGYEKKAAKQGLWETSASAAVRFKRGRFSVKLSSPDFPRTWEYTLSWRVEKK
jgi:hypothetical protein